MANAPKIFGQSRRKRQKQKRWDDRKTSHQRGYDKKTWRPLRDEYLQENPMCEHCIKIGIDTIGTEVDHKVPFDGIDDPLRLDKSNLQTLCHSHHVAKTYEDKRA